jgi:raffinose/stachyose/melibiose transport system substrate-binding protein
MNTFTWTWTLSCAALLAAVAPSLAAVAPSLAADATLTIESWRNDDLPIWQEKIIPAFEKGHPGIKLEFQPTAPKEYNAALNSKLDAGTAGDIIACRPFDASLELFKKGQLASVNEIPGMGDFSAIAKAGWSTDDGKTAYCVPVAAVLHGFIYNKAAFAKVGIKEPPKTDEEFFADLDALKKDGTYVPLAMGTPDQWEAATMGYQNIGPNYWHGEDGRAALIAGKEKLTDPEWVAPFQQLARWRPYLGDGFEAQSYPDSQNLFTLGRAAIYPAGSWEISTFESQAAFPMGVFPPPVPKAGDPCYVSDHPDIAFGMNVRSKNPDAAKAFLAWVASPEFAKVYSDSLPGFFSLQTQPVQVSDPLAQAFLAFRQACKSTMRSTYQFLSRGTPNLENETWVESANVLNGTDTPEQAAQKLQKGLDSWYKPVP